MNRLEQVEKGKTWNRYAYLANNPLNAVDPLGLYLYSCAYVGYSNCDGVGDSGEGDGDESGGGGGTGGGGSGGGGQQPINFPNETLGLPNGFPTNPWGVWGAIIPTAQCGDIAYVALPSAGDALCRSQPSSARSRPSSGRQGIS